MLLKILHQIQQDNKDLIKKFEKSFTATCKEEGISFEQVLLCFLMVYSLLILAFYGREFFLGQPITLSILCLQLYVMICNSSLLVWRDSI